MLLPDVNVLVHAHREDAGDHAGCARWLSTVPVRGELIAVVPVVLAGFIRIVTHPGIFPKPSPMGDAVAFIRGIIESANHVNVPDSPGHAGIFLDLCLRYGLKGNDIPDAQLAALAIEHGAAIVSLDRGFARFKEIRWLTPAEGLD